MYYIGFLSGEIIEELYRLSSLKTCKISRFESFLKRKQQAIKGYDVFKDWWLAFYTTIRL